MLDKQLRGDMLVRELWNTIRRFTDVSVDRVHEIVKKVMKQHKISLLHNPKYMPQGDYLKRRMLCPSLKKCFQESINRKHEFFEKERCTHKEQWAKCPIFLERLKERLLERST